MKAYSVIVLFLLSIFVISCADTATDLGKTLQSSSDQIIAGTDTFHLSSKTIFVESIIARPDSFLLGTFYDTKFGTTQAEILAQVNCPVGFKFPSNSVGDSAKVLIYYSSCFGDSLAPLDLNVYEMNKNTFTYTGLYPSNLNPSDYTDQSLKLGQRIIRAGANSSTSKIVTFRLGSDFVQRFSNDSHFASTNDFLNFFKGLYIKANFGASTLLNVGLINLRYYYHYTYQVKTGTNEYSTFTVNDYLTFPANSEVRQINRILHPDRASVVKPGFDVNYLASPANLQTQISIPLNRIKQRLNPVANEKKLTINAAMLRVDVANTDQDTILHPIVKYLLLVKESAIDRFFNNKELPTDTCSVIAHYSSTLKVGTTNVYEQYYSFNIAKLVANELQIAQKKNVSPPENLNLRLIPVSVGTTTSSSSTYISSVKQEFLMQAATILNKENATSPLRLSIVYSGF